MPLEAPIPAGQRDKAVRIESLTETKGASGAPIETWAPLDPFVWMRRRDLGAGEVFLTHQANAYADVEWIMAYRSDMDPELIDVAKRRRLVFRGRVYNILAARPWGGAGRDIRLLARADRGPNP